MKFFPNEINNTYTKLGKIGKGGYGVVYKVKKKNTSHDEFYAMKVVSSALSAKKDVETEIRILSDLKNPYLIHLEDLVVWNEEIFIITEFCENLDLWHKIKQLDKQLKEAEIWKYFIQICIGLECMHKNNFIHRDIKLENILLDKEDNIKIADFGVSRFQDASTSKGTPRYFPPEMSQKEPASESSDIWALGCVLYYLCQLDHPFGEDKMVPHNPISDCYSESMKYFVDQCLQKDKCRRPRIYDILSHPKIIGESLSLGISIPQDSVLFQSILKRTLQLAGFNWIFDDFTVEIKTFESSEAAQSHELIEIKSKIARKDETQENHFFDNSDHFSEKGVSGESREEIASQDWSKHEDDSGKLLENSFLTFSSDFKRSSQDNTISKDHDEGNDFNILRIRTEIEETLSYEEEKTQQGQSDENSLSLCEPNEMLFVKLKTNNVYALNLQTLDTKEVLNLDKNTMGYGSVWVPGIQSTFFYGEVIDIYTGNMLGTTFLVDKNATIKYLANGKPASWVGLAYHKNYVYAIGGWKTPVSEKYSISNETWESCAPLLSNQEFISSSCASFQDHILMVAYAFQKIKVYDIINDRYKNDLDLKPALSGCYKMMFCYCGRLYIAEASRNLYQSRVNDFDFWEHIGECKIDNFGPVSHSMSFMDKIYIYQYESTLIEFNLKAKTLLKVSSK